MKDIFPSDFAILFSVKYKKNLIKIDKICSILK